MPAFKINCILSQMCISCVVFKLLECYNFIAIPFIFIRFNDGLFTKFFDCMLEKRNECTAHIKHKGYQRFNRLNWNIYNATDINMSTKKNTKLNIYYCEIGYNILRCLTLQSIKCENSVLNCNAQNDSIGLFPGYIFMYSSMLSNCTQSCINYSLTFYRKVETTTIRPTVSTTKTTSVSTPRKISTTTRLSTTTISSTTLFTSSSLNTTMLTLNTETPDQTSNAPIIISVCVVGVIVSLLCCIIGFLVWRRYLKNTNGTKDLEISTVGRTITDSPDLLSSMPDNVIVGCSNCTIEDNYANSVVGEETSLRFTGNKVDNNSRDFNTVNMIDKASNSKHNLKMLDQTNNITENVAKDGFFKDKETDIDNYIVVENSEQDFGVDNFSTVETASSDYQRLRQERRDLKNPYQQLLPVEQEQQLTLSEQELSPYSLAKPVLAEATLQIIDVGAWVDNSDDTAGIREDLPYNNTIQDDFTPQH